jgi:hypothetical protein
VCVKNIGAKAFPLVTTLIWLCMLQPGRNMLVSEVQAVRVGAEQHIWSHGHNQIGII